MIHYARIPVAIVLLSLTLASAIISDTVAQAPPVPATSFKPGEIWPDDKGVHINAHGGGILWHKGLYYWFGEHKIQGDAGNKAHVGVHAYSSQDLYNWKDEGIALPVMKDSDEKTKSHSDIAEGCILERPKVIYNAATGKFVMWFHLELKGQEYKAARTALAVSDTITGPYRYVGSFRPNAGKWPENLPTDQQWQEGQPGAKENTLRGHMATVAGSLVRRDFAQGQMSRDMTLFVDEDAKGYLITAAEDNQTLHIHELTADYQGFTGKYVRVFPGAANEAPAIFKHHGKYYLIASGCSGWNPNAARSAVADSMMGQWTSLGNPCRGTKKEDETTFESQSTYVLPVQGKPGAFIFMADRWRPGNAIDGRYVWLPITWEGAKPVLKWRDSWNLSELTP